MNVYHLILSFFAALFYGFPSRKMKVIGVTGTNGKSTTALFITSILEEAGFRVAMASSIAFKIAGKEQENTLRMTMPGRFALQKFFSKANHAKCEYAVIEVTSEGIVQHRHRGINFHTAVFMNLSPEHIESHGGFEQYRNAKEQLFRATKGAHVVNLDDQNASFFLSHPAQKKIGYAITTQNAQGVQEVLVARNVQADGKGISLSVRDTHVRLAVPGLFNAYNVLAAIGVAVSEGISIPIASRALEKIQTLPGRMERIAETPFEVYVDYAFTPNALEQVYETFKKRDKDIICVLGAAGGGRDTWKRPVLGKIASQYCREVIVTNEDPYEEDPDEIMAQVASGTKDKATIIKDRREAISHALSLAKEHDVVVITGKGSESSMCVKGGKRIPWDDRAVTREELEKITSQ
jgi:UDP-N-acetylmuramoyl-L-alanyl-D-glutamate--2,6-diaminopimelate ligase